MSTNKYVHKAPFIKVFLVVLVVSIFVSSGCSVSNDTSKITMQNEVIPTETTLKPIETSEPTLTPTPTNTVTPAPTSTPDPTPTPTQRVWPKEVCQEFFLGNNAYVAKIYVQGWNLWDDEEILDDFPCYKYNNCRLSDYTQMFLDACEEVNDADYWCEEACEAVYYGFSADPRNSLYTDIWVMNRYFGDKNKEPYCPQFGDWFVPSTTNYRDFKCEAPLPEPTQIPQISLGWDQETRAEVEQKYLYPILGDLCWRDLPTVDYALQKKHVDELSDYEVCWVIANGHESCGFPEYAPSNPDRLDLVYSDRMELRDFLNSKVGVPVDGNPPLCPGFLDMIEEWGRKP